MLWRHSLRRAIAPAIALAVLAFVRPAAAQEPKAFFAGKQIRIIVGTDTGGSYDTTARLLAAHLGKFIPGNPTLIVENMPGASGIKAVNYLHTAAPKDGTVLADFNNSIPFYEAIGQAGVQFKSAQLSWIGTLSQTASVVAVLASTGVNSIKDAQQKEVVIGATGAAGTKAGYPALLNSTLGTKFKIVTGYPGSKAVLLAMESGEVQGDGSNPWSTWLRARPDWVKDHKLVPLVQIGLKKEKDLANVPLLTELATNDEQRAMFNFVCAPVAIQWPLAGPPGVPAERLAVLREAFDKVLQDPGFIADAQKQKLALDPLHGPEVVKIVQSIVQTPPQIAQKVHQAMTPVSATSAPGAKPGGKGSSEE